MSLKSIASTARPGSTSIRATIPEGIVAFLDLKTGDKLEWRMEIINNERVVIVKKTTLNDESSKIAYKYVKTKKK